MQALSPICLRRFALPVQAVVPELPMAGCAWPGSRERMCNFRRGVFANLPPETLDFSDESAHPR